MHRKIIPLGSLALALSLPAGAQTAAAPSSGDLDALRKEIGAMRADYESRIQSLEKRVKDAEATAAKAQWSAPPSAVAAGAAAATGTASTASTATPATPATPAAALPAPAPAAPTLASAAPALSGAGSASSFNPAISLILSGGYINTSRDPSNYAISGFARTPDAEQGPGTRSFSLGETELSFSASIDPYFRGTATLAVTPENEVEVEEAFVETTALGNGMTLKGGRFFSNIGYLNPQHAHVWDFVDAPLAYQAMLGNQYGNDGLQLKWVAPIDQYLEFNAEVGRGASFPGSETGKNGNGMYSLGVHTGGDVGVSNSWRAGVAVLGTKASDQALLMGDGAGGEFTNAFTGKSRVYVLDGVWKWAPDGNATRTNFKLQGEYLRAQRDGDMVVDSSGAAIPGSYSDTTSGWYLQGIYQFMPRWRVGLRTERLDAGTPFFAGGSELVANSGYSPSKNSLMLEYAPSEFSRVRLQYARDLAREGQPDNQIWIQYQMSLGAHGAHGF
ncbi:hypothetical protein [Variovorax sp. OV329]|uniref:hypothetical protein n=1 Tax=Variovorax sp. OV329 TaxID=1882825 RepID=UPI0008E92265|nr:hypothetical protein [Variovorax sp. OV329]SFL90256.1 hypothetical protein SAMN05444747_101198 [Variovorax sp. OV329]